MCFYFRRTLKSSSHRVWLPQEDQKACENNNVTKQKLLGRSENRECLENEVNRLELIRCPVDGYSQDKV